MATISGSTNTSMSFLAAQSFDLSVPKNALSLVVSNVYTSGTGAGNVDAVYHRSGTVTVVEGADTVDLEDLIDSFGVTFAFSRIVFFYFRNLAKTIITLSPAAPSTALVPFDVGGDLIIQAGQNFVTSDGVRVGSNVSTGSNSVFDIENTTAVGDVDYEIVIAGVKQ